jgi:hypothetical protein
LRAVDATDECAGFADAATEDAIEYRSAATVLYSAIRAAGVSAG